MVCRSERETEQRGKKEQEGEKGEKKGKKRIRI